jgi:tetratricopeptide (TPR) repeat protein
MGQTPQTLGPMHAEFAATLRSLRAARGMSLGDLAAKIHFHRGYVGNIEQGRKFPEQQFAVLADAALCADGALLRAWDEAHQERRDGEHTRRLLTLALKDSDELASATPEDLHTDHIMSGVERLAVGYLGTPPAPILKEGVTLRSEVIRRLRTGQYRPHEHADLFLAAGRLSGVLAYAALDLGHPQAALTHARAAWNCGDLAGDNELRAWVRGTQSLIARFQADYDDALAFARDGLRYTGRGTSEMRLLCGEAQCLANLEDSHEANKALDRALRARERANTPDSLSGLFEFSEAKQYYYAGSSLIWLDGKPNLQRAAHDAAVAISLWEHEPPERQPLDDEALCHIYQGTALLRLGELDEAVASIRPVLDLPPERRISWIGKRLGRVAAILHTEPYIASALAQESANEIREFAAAG